MFGVVEVQGGDTLLTVRGKGPGPGRVEQAAAGAHWGNSLFADHPAPLPLPLPTCPPASAPASCLLQLADQYCIDPQQLITCNPDPHVPSGAAEGEWAGASAAALLQHLHKPAFSASVPTLTMWDGQQARYGLDEPLPVGGTLRVPWRRPMDRPLSDDALLQFGALDELPCTLHADMRVCEALFKPVQVRGVRREAGGGVRREAATTCCCC